MTEKDNTGNFSEYRRENSEPIAYPIPEQRVPLITDYPASEGQGITKSQSKRLQLVREQLKGRIPVKPQHNYST